MFRPICLFFCCLIIGILFPLDSFSQINLPEIFSHHMVLQRGLPIPVWGDADSEAIVEVSLGQNKARAQADHLGNWKATLPPIEAGGPLEIVIQAEGETIRIEDIYIGEVWLCSGQSNMEWPLVSCETGEEEIPGADYPLLRFFRLAKKHDLSSFPFSENQISEFSNGDFFHPARWERCTPETAASFSGVGYFFGKELFDTLKVAIGLIQNAVGGSPAQSWISEEALASHPQLKEFAILPPNKTWIDLESIHPWLAVRAKENWKYWEKMDKRTPVPGHPFAPAYLYNNAIKPLAPYAIRGAIWYQGESNATHPGSYFTMMETMLSSWRSLWEQVNFPFYFVQLPKIGNRSLWPEFREAQSQCLSLPNTGMVVAIDEGHTTDVHPRRKKIIGQRLARLAFAKTYGIDISAESPALATSEWDKEGLQIKLSFRNAYEGLGIREGTEVKGFVLQGYTQQGTVETFLPPEKTTIEKNTITLTYPDGFLPVQVKYAWAPAPANNLVNSAGLPIAPFRMLLPGNN